MSIEYDNLFVTVKGYAQCGDPRCKKQMAKFQILPTTSEIYNDHNFCNGCKTLWEKPLLRCGHCNRKLRTKSRHRPNNSQGKTDTQMGIRRI